MAAAEKDQTADSLRSKALEWFFARTEIEKTELKEKHFPNKYIQYSGQWGYHFTFGDIEEMYNKEHKTVTDEK